MGSIIRAVCPCGFSTANLYLGGGMSSFLRMCAFPVRCSACHRFDVVNLYDSPAECGGCHERTLIPYDDPILVSQPGNDEIFSWETEEELGRTPILTDGTYLCPLCDRPELKFQRWGNWD
jgi:hypothetical protein